MVRDYTKWDDLPISLPHFAESAMRAYKIAMTPPMGPVVLVADSHLQETGMAGHGGPPRMPKLTLARPPAADAGAVAELAALLVAAENPVILGQAARTPEGMRMLVELAETLQAPVSGGTFPSRHPLRQGGGGLIRNADLIVGLDVNDLWGTVNTYLDQQTRSSQLTHEAGRQAREHYLERPLSEEQLSEFPALHRSRHGDRRGSGGDAAVPDRSGQETGDPGAPKDLRRAWKEAGRRFRTSAGTGSHRSDVWLECKPGQHPRLSAELWNAIKDHDWANVGGVGGGALWNVDKHYQVIDGGGVAAEGGDLPTAVGAALAHRKHGRLAVSIQKDGDFMYAPGALWTAAHHRIPFLSVMYNNRAYHQEVMHIQRMANRHQRGITNAGIGNSARPSRHRLCGDGACHGRAWRRPDHESQRSRARDQARRGCRSARRAGPGRRRDSTPIGGNVMRVIAMLALSLASTLLIAAATLEAQRSPGSASDGVPACSKRSGRA